MIKIKFITITVLSLLCTHAYSSTIPTVENISPEQVISNFEEYFPGNDLIISSSESRYMGALSLEMLSLCIQLSKEVKLFPSTIDIILKTLDLIQRLRDDEFLVANIKTVSIFHQKKCKSPKIASIGHIKEIISSAVECKSRVSKTNIPTVLEYTLRAIAYYTLIQCPIVDAIFIGAIETNFFLASELYMNRMVAEHAECMYNKLTNKVVILENELDLNKHNLIFWMLSLSRNMLADIIPTFIIFMNILEYGPFSPIGLVSITILLSQMTKHARMGESLALLRYSLSSPPPQVEDRP